MHDDDISFFFDHGPDCSCGPESAEDRYWGGDHDDDEVPDDDTPEHSDDWMREAMALAGVEE